MFDQDMIGQACDSAVDSYGDFAEPQRRLILSEALAQRGTGAKAWRANTAKRLLPSKPTCPFPPGANNKRVAGLAQALVKRYDRLSDKANALPAAPMALAPAAPVAPAAPAPASPVAPAIPPAAERVPCPKCSKSLGNNQGLVEHLKYCKGPKPASPAPTMGICSKCGTRVGSLEGLFQHELHCTGPKVKAPAPNPAPGGRCCLCNVLIMTAEGLESHERHCGGPREPVPLPTTRPCPLCHRDIGDNGYEEHVLHCQGGAGRS